MISAVIDPILAIASRHKARYTLSSVHLIAISLLALGNATRVILAYYLDNPTLRDRIPSLIILLIPAYLLTEPFTCLAGSFLAERKRFLAGISTVIYAVPMNFVADNIIRKVTVTDGWWHSTPWLSACVIASFIGSLSTTAPRFHSYLSAQHASLAPIMVISPFLSFSFILLEYSLEAGLQFSSYFSFAIFMTCIIAPFLLWRPTRLKTVIHAASLSSLAVAFLLLNGPRRHFREVYDNLSYGMSQAEISERISPLKLKQRGPNAVFYTAYNTSEGPDHVHLRLERDRLVEKSIHLAD